MILPQDTIYYIRYNHTTAKLPLDDNRSPVVEICHRCFRLIALLWAFICSDRLTRGQHNWWIPRGAGLGMILYMSHFHCTLIFSIVTQYSPIGYAKRISVGYLKCVAPVIIQ